MEELEIPSVLLTKDDELQLIGEACEIREMIS